MEVVLIILKYIGILISGVFGVYGLMMDFKDDKGKVTKAGNRALKIIIISSLISISSQTVEIYLDSKKEEDDNKKALKEIQQNSKILHSIDRAINPIENVRISYSIKLDPNHKKISPYYKRLTSTLPKTIDTISTNDNYQFRKLDVHPVHIDRYDKIRSVRIGSNSNFFPNPILEPVAFNVLRESEIQLDFFKKDVAIESIMNLSRDYFDNVDLSIRVSAGIDRRDYNNRHYVELELDNFQLNLESSFIHADSKYWESNGNIIGIPDLLNSTLVVWLPNTFGYGDDDHNKIVDEIKGQFELERLTLKLSKGREFWIRRDSLKFYKTSNGEKFFVFKLPASIEELNNLN